MKWVTTGINIKGNSPHLVRYSLEMATLNEYRSKLRLLSKQEVISERRELFKIINGDAFYPLKAWPKEYRPIFFAKPIGNKDAFKLMLFCLGNGCSPELITKWIMLSQNWLPSKAEKGARQLDFIVNNADVKRGSWFYFDMDYGKLLYLNGLPKETTK